MKNYLTVILIILFNYLKNIFANILGSISSSNKKNEKTKTFLQSSSLLDNKKHQHCQKNNNNNNYSKVFELYLNFNNDKIFDQKLWYKLWSTNLPNIQNFMMINTKKLILETPIFNNDTKPINMAEWNMKCLKNVTDITIKFPNLNQYDLFEFYPYKNYLNLQTLDIKLDGLKFDFDQLPTNLKSFTLYCVFNIDMILINNRYCTLNHFPQNLQNLTLKSDDPCLSFSNHYYYDKNNVVNTHVYSKFFTKLPKNLKYFRLDTSTELPKILLDTLLPKNLKNFNFPNTKIT